MNYMMGKDNQEKSTRLFAVLEDIGASEDIRQLFRDTSNYIEIALTDAICRFKTSAYYFGSCCEGTTSVGLRSDIDVLVCLELIPVIEYISETTDILCYIMVRDCNTKPGYVQLQTVVNRIPQYNSFAPAIPGSEEYDDYGRLCLIHPSLRIDGSTTAAVTINGPAVTMLDGMDSIDIVNAVRCRKIPYFANSWLHRTRQYDWPSHKQVQRMKSFGCFLVGVAHPYSHNKSIEWRISFSLQERKLMQDLNPTQHKCYILLKMIKKDLIEPGNVKSISSYHCKTCLFYTIETSESSVWTPENLILCTRLCLVRLLNWTKNGNCPNYFIPEENMFDRLDKQTLENLNTALTDVLSNRIEFIFRLKCDDIGTHLFENLSGMPHIERDFHKILEYKQKRTVAAVLYTVRSRYLLNIIAESDEILCRLKRLLIHLQERKQVTEHSTRDVRMAMSITIPYIHLQIAQSMASVEIRRRGTNNHNFLPLDILCNIIDSSPSSRISARLSIAACYIQFRMIEACEQLLLAVETSFKPNVISVCSCYTVLSYTPTYFKTKINDSYNTNTKEFIEQYTTGCMMFLQSQANIVHPALQYEMYRSVYTQAGSRHEGEDFWFDWVVVDPKVYLYFLQYIFCTKTNKPGHKRQIVETCRHIIKEDDFMFHRETAYNVLGWMLIQENRAIEAWQCICQSWRIRPFHNAAKWHIILLLNNILHIE